MILGLPLAVFLLTVVVVLTRVHELRRVAAEDFAEQWRKVDDHLARKPGAPAVIERMDGHVTLATPEQPLLPLEVAPGKRIIAFFGGSSLVFPERSVAFPTKVAEKLNARFPGGPGFQVLNLGAPGLDSFAVRNRVKALYQVVKPDLLVVYSGHNDYSFNYRGNHWDTHCLTCIFRPVQNSALLRLLIRPVFWVMLAIHRGDMGFQNFLMAHADPFVMKVLLQSGLITMPQEFIQKINEVILKHYKANIHSVMEMARKARTPVLLLTPISNLMMPPRGVSPETMDWFDQAKEAMKTNQWRQVTDLLIRARDADVFSWDTRAKTPMLEWLRQIKSEGVSVLDLEPLLLTRKPDMRESFFQFIDGVHFQPELHDWAADVISKAIVDRHLCCGL